MVKKAGIAAQTLTEGGLKSKNRIEVSVVDGKIGRIKELVKSSGFRDSFNDGGTWRDTFADGGQWVSNFNNLGANSQGLRHPVIQATLEKLRAKLDGAVEPKAPKTPRKTVASKQKVVAKAR